jgi:hypothetical protein
MTGPPGHRDINVNCREKLHKKYGHQVTKQMPHWFQQKQNKHDKNESFHKLVNVMEYQMVTFIMKGSDYLPLLPSVVISSPT